MIISYKTSHRLNFVGYCYVIINIYIFLNIILHVEIKLFDNFLNNVNLYNFFILIINFF